MCTGPAIASFGELRMRGRSRGSIESAVRRGDLVRLRRGVYASLAACDPARTAALHGGTLACVTAARHLGLWVLCSDETVHVGLGRGGHTYRHGEHDDCGCIEHWDGAGGGAFGVPPVPRVLRQILGCLGVEEFFVTVESALRKGLLDQRGLDWLRANTNSAGRKALAHVRWDADSGLESLLRWRLRRYRLRVTTQVWIPSTGKVDLLIGDRLLIEADGHENHDGGSHRHKDLLRDAHAAMWGYSTLRFDYKMIVHDWDLVESAILGRLGLLR